MAAIWRNALVWQAEREAADSYLRQREKAPVLKDSPLVSVLAAVWNREDDLPALVKSFLAVDYPNKELIVALGGVHRPDSFSNPAANVIIAKHPGGGKVAAMAECLAKAQGEIIYATDGDCRLTSEGFRRLIAPIVNGEEAATSGGDAPLPCQSENAFVAVQFGARVWVTDTRQFQAGLLGRNYAVRRSALDAVGGFQFKAPVNEDAFLGRLLHHAGFRIRRVPESLVDTNYHGSLLAYIRQHARWRRGNILVALEFGENSSAARQVATCCSALCILGLTLLAPRGGRSLKVVAYLLFLRRLLARLRHMALVCRIGYLRWRNSFIPLVVVQMYADYLVGALALVQLLSPSLRKRW